MSTAFRTKIRQSIDNEVLQIALEGNARRRAQGRLTAFQSLPDGRERRERAHRVRAEVVAHLDEYLDNFISKAEANGLIIHRAADAAQAVRKVLEIAAASPQSDKPMSPAVAGAPGRGKLIAKSKSMISEEIELNRALEAAGHRVVETDLGEYIVQLRGERPSHIISPAVHLRRQEVGQLFHEKLGIPYTEDIPRLVGTARQLLREVFFAADIGISGVNFGVAENGTLCIVTNEGNGRMIATLPAVHIALMGMERLVPTLEDLALMLSLLARSATGQKLSVYTQLIHSPRRAGETDGPQERHLIILDNGRSRLQDSNLREALYCIRCGACLNACPVFRELGGHAYVGDDGSMAPYPGPIGSVVSPGLLGLKHFGHLAQASSLCGACKDACPVDIDLPRLLTRVRAGGGQDGKLEEGVGLSRWSRLGLHAYGRLAASPRLFTLTQKLAAIGTRIVSPLSSWIWLPAFTGWGYSKDFPRFATKPFRERFHPTARGGARLTAQKEADPIAGVQKEQHANLVDRFSQELRAVGGQTERIPRSELTGRLITFLKERRIEEVLMWDHIEAVDEMEFVESGLRIAQAADARVRAGITGAGCAIAETGTLVIASSPAHPMAASLLPEIHIAIIRSSQIVFSLEEALLQPEVPEASAISLVTGPSRTADIEMALTIGVHGPKEVHVFLVDD